MIVAPAIDGSKPVKLPAIDKEEQAFEAMKDATRSELEKTGLDPDKLPNYPTVPRQIKDDLGKPEENISGYVRN